MICFLYPYANCLFGMSKMNLLYNNCLNKKSLNMRSNSIISLPYAVDKNIPINPNPLFHHLYSKFIRVKVLHITMPPYGFDV